MADGRSRVAGWWRLVRRALYGMELEQLERELRDMEGRHVREGLALNAARQRHVINKFWLDYNGVESFASNHPFVSYHAEYTMSDQAPEAPEPQEDSENQHVTVHVRMRGADRGFSWTFMGDDAVERAKNIAEWVRKNPDEWVTVENTGDETQYSLREVSRIEIRGWGGTVINPEDNDVMMSEEDMVQKFREEMDQELGGTSDEEREG